MIVNERVVAYINSLDMGNSHVYGEFTDKQRGEILDLIEKEARETGVPIIREEMKNFLRVLLRIAAPKSILEIGTAVGFSSVLMADSTPLDVKITTIENYDVRIPIARENFSRAGVSNRITLLEGDAAEVLKGLEGPYDFVFLDAAKGQYMQYLKEIKRMLPAGGILLTDNVMQEGSIIESRFAVERRDRTIHERMREFNYELTHSEEFQTSLIPIGDGIALSVKL